MSLRLRLIVAFFFLSVVPLAAVTLFTYASNARAMREAAGREAELLAGELSQRMQVVTAQLSERVERLMDVAEARAEASAATAALATTGTTEPTPAVVVPARLGRELVHADVRGEDVVDEAVRAARARRACLIVAATRGNGPLRAELFGSLSTGPVHSAARPVALISAEAADPG